MLDPLTTAAEYVAAGLSVLPIRIDGTKRPDGVLPPDPKTGIHEWAPYKHRLPSDSEIVTWFTHPKGIGIIGGAISGSLEVLDIETAEAVEQWGALIMSSETGRSLLQRLPRVSTPGGGMHVYYRCERIQGNQKLARTELPDGKIKTVIETRGEGGYVVAPGSPPSCHESGRPYELLSGKLTAIPVIGPDERALLLDCARALDTLPKDHLPAREERVVEFTGVSVAEHYNHNTTWAELLQPNGWKYLKTHRNGTEEWQCPHSHDAGNCATIRTYEGAREVFHVFCTNQHGFSAEKSYSKFQAYAILEHMGDQKHAAQSLRTLWGWKKRKPPEPKEPVAMTPVKQQAQLDLLATLGRFYNTDRSNAQRLCFYYGDNIRYVPTRGWVIWDLGKWHDDQAGQSVELMKQLPERILEEASSVSASGVLTSVGGDDVVNVRKELFKHAVYSASTRAIRATEFQARSHPDLMVPQGNFDTNPREINLINGVLNLETGVLRQARPTDYFFRQANVFYDAEAECPNFKDFLRQIFIMPDSHLPNEELIAYVQRALGYSLSGQISDQCLFFCYGDGANGKSTLLDLIYHILGDYSRSCPQHTFADDKRTEQTNDLARLPGVRFLRSNEVKQDSRMDENLIKKVTGGDVITARLLNKEFFDFVPQFKIWIDGNHKPTIRGLDHGIWRRIQLVPFLAKFEGKAIDHDLPEKLRQEIPGIFNWMVNGYQYWSAQGLMAPETVKKATKEYQQDMDGFGEFVKEHVIVAQGITTLASVLYQEYCKWSQDTGHGIMSQTRFGRTLSQRGYRKSTVQSGINKDRTVYHHIALRGRE